MGKVQFIPPRNFVAGGIAQDLYPVGVGYQYGSVAAAIAAATAASVAKAIIEVHGDLTENLEIPEEMTVKAVIQQGYPTATLTGSVRAIAGATGFANLIGFQVVGDGTEATIVSDSAANLWVSKCILVNSGDFPLLSSDTTGANVNLVDCQMISSAATAPMLEITDGNISTLRCANLAPASGVFATIADGTLTDIGSSFRDQIITTVDGGFGFVGTSLSVVTGSCIDHDGSFVSSLVRCSLSGSAAGDVLSGSGQISYTDVPANNNAHGVESTLDFRPYLKMPTSARPTTYELVESDTLGITQWDKILVGGNGGPVTLTSTPNITLTNIPDGFTVTLIGTSHSNPVTLQDEINLPGSGLRLKEEENMTLCLKDSITLMYVKAFNEWLELHRAHLECSSGYGYYGCGCLGEELL